MPETRDVAQGIVIISSSALHFSLSYQEEFKKDNGEELIQVLCEKEQAETGAGVCSLLLAQSEVKPHCLLLLFTNRTGTGCICLGVWGGSGGSGAEVRESWVEIWYLSSKSTDAGEKGRADLGRWSTLTIRASSRTSQEGIG